MKTSTKIALATLLVFFAGLALYDWGLAVQFFKGNYTRPFYHYVKMDRKDFDQIELRSSSTITLTVSQGDFNVLAQPEALQFLELRQEGRKLIINARFNDHWRGISGYPALHISCPTLSVFTADAMYFVHSDTITDRLPAAFYRMPAHITGFVQDSLTIREDHAADVVLEGNTIGRFSAILGEMPGENGPGLTLEDNNHFQLTDLKILSQSRLSINGTVIRHLTYTLADSASLTIDGVAAHYLNQH
jgi:hypothetical protein